MKELLIYGALVAAIITASVPIIQGLSNQITNGGQRVNTMVQTQINNLATAFGG